MACASPLSARRPPPPPGMCLGWTRTIIPDEFSSAALAQVLTPLAEARVLLPVSSLAETTLADALRAQGALVTCVVAYQTVIGSGGVDLPRLLRRGEIDAITLTSSSAATNLRRRVRETRAETKPRCARFPLAALAPGQPKQRVRWDLRVVAVPETHTLAGLIASLDGYFARGSGSTRQESESMTMTEA